MKQYQVTGMSCAACSARVEKAVSSLEGVSACSVNLLTGTLMVDGTATDITILAAVEGAGYGIADQEEAIWEDRETSLLRRRFWSSLLFLLPLMFLSMGHMIWTVPLSHSLNGSLQFLLTAVVMIINRKFFISGTKSLLKGAPNMDTLVALGAGAAFLYSTLVLFLTVDIHGLYFESSAMILTLITVGKMLEARSKGRTTDALKSLISLTPKTAILEEDGKEKVVPASAVQVGDIFLVKPGASIPADGIVLEGNCAVNESALTGESIPVDKEAGDSVSAATVSQWGFLRCRATKVGKDTALSQIIKMVQDGAATKAPIAKVADRVSGIFVPFVMAIALLTTVIWLLLGETVGFSLARGISVLVISCPCALGLATPVAIMVGSGVGAKNSILFKTAASLEEMGRVTVVALDKTGTITKGQPKVTHLLPEEGITKEELLSLALTLEAKSEHPLAKAIVEKGREENLSPAETRDFAILPGNGLTAKEGEGSLFGGNLSFLEGRMPVTDETKAIANRLAEEGKTPLFFGRDKTLYGIIAVADAIKEDSAQAIKELKTLGIRTVMLTGDNPRTAKAVAEQTGIDEVIAGVLPGEKEGVIRSLQEKGKVAMVGDGINDAPALTVADVGVAIGAGTEVAIDAADVVLMKSSLSEVPSAMRLSRATLRNIHQNLFWAFLYNTMGIPLAAGVFIPLFGWELSPMFGAAAMSLSSFCVVTNALRLNFCKIKNKKEEKTMEVTMKIEGMMCPHCEARVKNCLEGMEGVAEAVVSHKEGTAIVKLAGDISYATLKKAVEEQGYTVTD